MKAVTCIRSFLEEDIRSRKNRINLGLELRFKAHDQKLIIQVN